MLQKRTPLRLGKRWFDALEASVDAFIVGEAHAEEYLLGALRTGPAAAHEEGRGWLIVTVSRSFLVCEVEEVLHVEELASTADLRCEARMGRDVFWAGDRVLFEGPLVGGRKLRRLFEVAALQGHARLLQAARAHHEDGAPRWDEAGTVECEAVYEAHLEAGEAAKGAGRYDEAARHFLAAIRWQMQRPEGYAGLFAVAPRLRGARRAQAELARQVLGWVDPQQAAGLAAPLTRLRVDSPDQPIGDDAHDEQLVHPDERCRKAAVHRLLARWAHDGGDDEALRTHCRRVDAQEHPDVVACVRRVAELLDVPAPPVHLSGQPAGVCALGRQGNPFILMAQTHVDADSPRRLTGGQLAFALGMQVEHIRAGHLLLTRDQYVGALKRRGVDLALMAGEWLGARGLLGAMGARSVKATKPLRRLDAQASGEWLALTVDAARAEPTALARWAKGRAQRGGDTPRRDPVFERRGLADFARVAQYTADRAGLVACGSLDDAIGAMFRLREGASHALMRLRRRGLAGLGTRDVPTDLAARVEQLCRFALSQAWVELHG